MRGRCESGGLHDITTSIRGAAAVCDGSVRWRFRNVAMPRSAPICAVEMTF